MAALNAVTIKVTEPYWFNNLGYIAISTAELIIAVCSNYTPHSIRIAASI